MTSFRQVAEILLSQGLSLETAARYPESTDPTTLVGLVEAGVEPLETLEWLPQFDDGFTIAALIRAGLTPLQMERWPERFTGLEIAEMHTKGVQSDRAEGWADRFRGADIAYLTRTNVAPHHAAAYPDWMNALQIGLSHRVGIKADIATVLLSEPVAYDAFKVMLEEIWELQRTVGPIRYPEWMDSAQAHRLLEVGVTPSMARVLLDVPVAPRHFDALLDGIETATVEV